MIRAFLLFAMMLACTGCIKKSDDQMNEIGQGIWRDSRTGCDYIRVPKTTEFMLRRDANGKHLCKES